MNRQELGREGEERAIRHLQDQGFTIVTRNAHSRRGEIDIVALENDLLVFVEVKLRRRNAPDETITPTKASRMREAARDYLFGIGEPERSYRFDFIALGSTELRHHRDVLRD